MISSRISWHSLGSCSGESFFRSAGESIASSSLAMAHFLRETTKRASARSASALSPRPAQGQEGILTVIVGPLPRFPDAEERRHRGLAGSRVLARPLSQVGGGGREVEQVVGDLEGEPELLPRRAEPLVASRRGDGAPDHRGREQGTGLAALQIEDAVQAGRIGSPPPGRATAPRPCGWPPRRAARPAARGGRRRRGRRAGARRPGTAARRRPARRWPRRRPCGRWDVRAAGRRRPCRAGRRGRANRCGSSPAPTRSAAPGFPPRWARRRPRRWRRPAPGGAACRLRAARSPPPPRAGPDHRARPSSAAPRSSASTRPATPAR